jgi:hypothetical protein
VQFINTGSPDAAGFVLLVARIRPARRAPPAARGQRQNSSSL